MISSLSCCSFSIMLFSLHVSIFSRIPLPFPSGSPKMSIVGHLMVCHRSWSLFLVFCFSNFFFSLLLLLFLLSKIFQKIDNSTSGISSTSSSSTGVLLCSFWGGILTSLFMFLLFLHLFLCPWGITCCCLFWRLCFWKCDSMASWNSYSLQQICLMCVVDGAMELWSAFVGRAEVQS